jgi:hypothetical protein
VKGEGIVLNEPSVVAVERRPTRSRAIGLEAKRMLGRTPEGSSRAPAADGVIADVDVAEMMLRHFLEMVTSKRLFRIKPRVVIGVPSRHHRDGAARGAQLGPRGRRQGGVAWWPSRWPPPSAWGSRWRRRAATW